MTTNFTKKYPWKRKKENEIRRQNAVRRSVNKRQIVLPKSHHLAGRVTTPSPVVRKPARAEKAYRTTAVKKKSRFRTSPVNTGYYLDIWVASVRRRRRWRPPGLRVVDLTLTRRFRDKLSMVDLRWHSGVLADGWTSLRRDKIEIASV
jgi:hypothetical protein